MNIRFCSDIHIEFMNPKKINTILDKIIEKQNNDKEIILVIAGDFGKFSDIELYIKSLNHLAKRFKYIVAVAGNHEYYGYNDFPYIPLILTEKLSKNIFLLENESIVIDNTPFIGCSLFTNINNSNPIDMFSVKNGMNDFRYIQKQTSAYSISIKPEDYIIAFNKSKEFIFSECKKYNNPIVVTHFSPTIKTIDIRYENSNLNFAYVSDLYSEIYNSNIAYWICGHQHQTLHFKIGNTIIIQNAFGYYEYDINNDFISNFRVDTIS